MGACDGYCCVAKRFDRPFRLPASRSPDPASASLAPDTSSGRSASRDWDAGADGADATSVSGADELTTRLAGLVLIEDDDDCGEEETETQEAAARSRLIELLDAVPCADGATGGDDGSGGGGIAQAQQVRCDAASLRAFARDTLPPLVHLSHRRERHCRIMLQHPNADALAWRLHDLLVGASRSASLGQADGETPQLCASHYYDDAARELASLLVHNLSVAASSKEPRDEDRFKPRDDGEDDEEDEDREEAGDSAEDDDGAKAPSLSLVNHPTWEGIVRAIFDDVERLVDVREVAATGGMRSVRRERRERARLSSPTEYEEWSKKQFADGRMDSDDDDDANDNDTSVSPEDHDALCRGRLGTAVGAVLAAMEPDSARPKLLAMDGGAFFPWVFRTCSRILPSRHGDASLDAVGVMHRLLWIRPDATTAERETLMRALVEMDDDETDGSEETKEERQEEPNETKDPLWTWTRERGYESCPPHKGDLDVPDEERVASDSNLRPHDSTTAQAERVSVNGVIAALRTHLPWPVGVAGDRLGAGGGSLACTQALHVLRAMFEDLGVIEAQRKYGRAGEGGKTEALWPQLRGDQLGDLVTQLAVVIEVLGQPAKTVQKKDKDKDKDKGGACVEKKKDGKDNEGGTEVDGFWIPEEDKPEEIPPSGLDVEINSQKPGGGWDTWRTVIPKEGECDGALGAAVGILNALCTHPVLFHVIDGHPRLHDVIRAVTRASASQCSCAWATFSCVVNLSTRAAKCDEETGDPVHALGDALLASPSAGHLLRGLANAVCDKWPIMSVDEMPPVQCLPPPDPPERAARRQRKETRRKERETKRNKRPRRDTWKEKTPKQKAKERRREAKRLARKNWEKAAAGGDESAGDVVESSDPPASGGAFDSSTKAVSTPSSAPIDDSDDSDSDADATHPNDPLANPANRLLLRTTAAAALASLARVQRRWDEDDEGGDASDLYAYDPSAADAIDVDVADVDPDTGRRRWVSPGDRVEILGPRWRELAEFGKRIHLRREWAEANAIEAAARRENNTPETTTVADSDESTHSDEEDEPEPFRLDPSAVAAAAWPADRGALPKGPLPGGVDPEGILATVPLLDDIFAALSKPDTEDVGVAVEAVETLAAHEDARELLIPFAPAVIPKLIRHIAGTARQMEEARANGGVVKQPPEENEKEKEKGEVTGDGFWIPGDDAATNETKETSRKTKSKRRKKRRRRKKPPTTVANLCARNALLVHTLYSVAKEAENAEEGSAWHLLLESTDELLPSFLTLLRPVPVNDAKPWLNDMAPPSDDPSSTQSGVVRALRLSAGSTHSINGHKDPNPSATREMIGELGRNALIVLAEMADPANSRFDPDKGMRWAKHIIAHRRDLITVLLDIMAVTGANDAVDAERRRLHEERTSKSTPSSAAGGTGTNGTGNGTVTGLHGGELDPVSKETRGGSVHGNSLRDGLEGIPEDEESKPWDDETHSGRYATLADVNLTEHERGGGFTLNGVGTNHEGANQPAVFVFPERPSSVASGPPSLVESVGDDYDFSEERREREEIIGDGGPESVASEGGASVDGDAAASSIEHASEQFALTPDCAHIAAAAVFGIISWDPCMDKLLSALETGETRRDGVAVLVSRVVALLADALPRRKDGSEEDGDVIDIDEGHEGGFRSAPGGVEAVGLIARLTGSDAGRRALLAHAPGVVGYLLPCLRADLGQTAAFAVRALCGIARSRHGMQLLLKHERAERLMAALSGMLPDPAGIAVFFEGDAVDRRRRGDGAHGQVLSEVVIAIATLSQEKAWRWRLLDIESDQPQALPPCLESDSVSTSEADTLVGMYLRRPGREFSTVRLVASLIALLRDEHREVVFNTLYCINCLMGEPPQSWGRGRDPNREEDNVARRALIAAAALGHRIAKIGCADESVSSHTSLESNLAHVLNSTGRVQTSAKAGKDPNRDTNSDDATGSDAPNVEPPETSEPEGRHPDDGPAPDCRLNATLVVANIAGDVEGRRMILGSVVDGVSAELVDGLATMLTGRDADRAMLAAYSMGELARPLRLDGEDPAVYPREVGESPGDVTLVPLTEMSENSSVRVGIRAASADDSFLGAQTDAVDRAFDSMPNHPLRDQVRDMLKTSAANARCAAVDVLGGDGANLKRWVETGYARVEDEPFDATSDSDSPELAKRRTRRARDHAIGAVLRDLDLNVKRQWLLEMLRWELGQVNAGVPVPGLTGVTLTCEREFPLEDLCHHCCVSNAGTDAPSSTQPGTFLMPPRGGVLVKFKGERGAGAAVRREWMSIVAASACDRSNLLFSSNDGGVTLHPNGMSGEVTSTHLEYFASLGRLAAVALYHGETLPLRLTSAFCSRLLGHEMRLEDLKSVDPTLYRNQVEYVQTHGVAGLDLTWSDTADPTGVFRPGKVLRLRHPREWSSDDGGEGPGHVDTDDADDTDDTDENKEALEAVTDADSSVFLRALVHHRVLGAVRDQTSAFAAGFGAVVPPQLRARMRGILDGGDVSSLIAGAASIDLDDWRKHAAYQEATLAFAFSTECFWCAMDEFTVDERIKVLQFATGLTSPPAGGFRNLVGYLGDAVPFTLGELAAPSRDEDGALPMAHACFNVLRLPRLVEGAFGVGVEGGSKEMARRLRIAIGVGVQGFDDF